MDALGHIHPILSIVRELRRRGHRAIILTTRPLNGAKRLEDMGFELESCQEESGTPAGQRDEEKSDDVLMAIMRPVMENFRRGQVEAFKAAYRSDGVVGKHLDDMIKHHDIIEAKMRSLRPDLVVYDHVIGIPAATTVAPRWARVYSGFPSVLYSSLNENYVASFGLKRNEMNGQWKELELTTKLTVRRKLKAFWKEKGLEDWPLDIDLTPTSPYLNFYLGPRELGLEQYHDLKSLPASWFRLEHTIDDEQGSEDFQIPEQLIECPGKLIYFSLGTLVTCDTDLINRLLAMLSKSPNKFIVSMGQMHKHIKLYPNMWGEQFVDQRGVLKKADLFITHGGHNSIIEAFYFGVPGLIVLPVFADQFDSAQRVEDCGFGCRLNPFDCTEDALLKSIDMTLANEELKERMQSARSRLMSIKYHRVAADKLEQLLSL